MPGFFVVLSSERLQFDGLGPTACPFAFFAATGVGLGLLMATRRPGPQGLRGAARQAEEQRRQKQTARRHAHQQQINLPRNYSQRRSLADQHERKLSHMLKKNKKQASRGGGETRKSREEQEEEEEEEERLKEEEGERKK
eukprot:GHVT01011403.1.p1 GENE.GHVT01011403.1~~GHVT01011403.1.p1  ORF type:complete len:140 (+),score=41.98 GHVT01011403.1:784-1203(+)